MLTFYWTLFKRRLGYCFLAGKWSKEKLHPSVSFSKSSQGTTTSNIIYKDGPNQTVFEDKKIRK